ncbi:MAG: MASE1 domain-containing protein, partial [Betaproteobacteria bacterium]|nr:MASE1 domain-containing protein [Betaproteobacteria bacterium]
MIVVGYLFAYVLLDWASYIHPVAPFAITPWNPPSGLSIALLLVFGLRCTPVVFVAAVLAEVVVRGAGGSPIEIASYAAILSGGYAAMAAFLLRGTRFDPSFKTLRDLVIFGVTAAVGAMGVAVCYVSAHVLAGAFTWNEFPEYALRDWVGEVIGIMILTPALLIHGPALARTRRWRLSGAAIVQALSIVAALWVVFAANVTDPSKLFYVLFLPLIWISVMNGLRGATLALVATQVGLIVSLQLVGYGARVVVEFQLLMLALAVTGAFLGMAVDQWRRAQDTLRTSEAELSAVVSMAPDAILILDGAGRVIDANAAAEALFRASSGGLVGSSVAGLIPGLREPFESLQGREVRARRFDGTTFPSEVAFSSVPIGERKAYIGIVRDTTRRKEIEDRLRERERELDRAMRVAAAAEMASVLAHELNQPLT